jgi:hypothetical protein
MRGVQVPRMAVYEFNIKASPIRHNEPTGVVCKTQISAGKGVTPQKAHTLDSGAKCNRAMQTGFARLCQAL